MHHRKLSVYSLSMGTRRSRIARHDPPVSGFVTTPNQRGRRVGAKVAGLVVLAVVASLPGVGIPTKPSPAFAQLSQRRISEALTMVMLTNRVRSSVGLDNLTVRDDLTELACTWAESMVRAAEVSHSPFIHDRSLLSVHVGPDWSLAGENVGSGSDVYLIHVALVNSPSHYRNLVSPEFRHVGICVRYSSEGTAYVAEEFLAPTPTKRTRSKRGAFALSSPSGTINRSSVDGSRTRGS